MVQAFADYRPARFIWHTHLWLLLASMANFYATSTGPAFSSRIRRTTPGRYLRRKYGAPGHLPLRSIGQRETQPYAQLPVAMGSHTLGQISGRDLLRYVGHP